MTNQIEMPLILTSPDPSISVTSLEAEIQEILKSEAVHYVAEKKGVDADQIATLEFKIRVDDSPAFSPGDLATLAITVVILNPLGEIVKEVAIDIWKEIIFPRLKSWANANTWSLKPNSNLDNQQKGE